MADYKKNPKVPFEVKIPQKIRKRIAIGKEQIKNEKGRTK